MHYDCKKGGEFFNYMTFKLMVIEQQNGRWKPALQGAKLTLLGPTDVTGFREQIGSNTNYIIHPEEILADNFVLLVNEQNVSTPRIVNDMKKIFQVR
jgi:hypothetical protein